MPDDAGRWPDELRNAPFLAGGTGEDFRAGIERAVARGWLWLHESVTYLKFTEESKRAPACFPMEVRSRSARNLSLSHGLRRSRHCSVNRI